MGAVQNTNAFWLYSMRRIVQSATGRRCMYVLGGSDWEVVLTGKEMGTKTFLSFQLQTHFHFLESFPETK